MPADRGDQDGNSVGGRTPMSRAKKWVALTGLGAALTAGPGCAMLDQMEDALGCGCSSTSESRRESPRGIQPLNPQDPPAGTPTTTTTTYPPSGKPAAGTGVTTTGAGTGTAGTQPGVYQDSAQK